MTELERWGRTTGKSLTPSHETKTYGRAAERVRNEAQLAGLEQDAIAALTAKAMERAQDLDSYRRQLADGDEVLNQVLARIELAGITKLERRLRGFGETL